MAAISRRNTGTLAWDGPLASVVFILAVFGFFMVLSASAPSAEFRLSDGLFFFKKQVAWGALGFVAMFLGAGIATERLRAASKVMIVLSAAFLAATYIPHIGISKLGAARWLRLGPMSFQPSEFAKLGMVMYLADVLARKPEGPWTFKDLRQTVFPVLGLLGLVVFQPDLGTTLILAGIAFAMFLCAGMPLTWLLGGGGTGLAYAAYHALHTPYQRDRFLAFVNPWAHPKDIGFQLIQSLLAIGSGGIFGTGWGQGKQKLFYLPIQHTDFIFAVVGEELGLIGTILVVALFVVLAQRGFSIAQRARSPHAKLLATGITAGIVFQAFLNIAVVTASVPTTGVPLPFLSFGGTSLLVTLFSVGLLLGVSRSSRTSGRLLVHFPQKNSPSV